MEPILLKGLHNYFPPNCELFCDVKTKNRYFGKSKKTENRNGHVFCNGTINSKQKKTPVHNSTSKLCIGLFYFWKQLKLGYNISMPILWYHIMRAHIEKVGVSGWCFLHNVQRVQGLLGMFLYLSTIKRYRYLFESMEIIGVFNKSRRKIASGVENIAGELMSSIHFWSTPKYDILHY